MAQPRADCIEFKSQTLHLIAQHPYMRTVTEHFYYHIVSRKARAGTVKFLKVSGFAAGPALLRRGILSPQLRRSRKEQ